MGEGEVGSEIMPNATAEERKRVGNELFGKGKIDAAIDAYSEAICFDQMEPVYYTNRAMCHRRKENWEGVRTDCSTALHLNDASIKGHYLLGVALEAQAEYDTAVSHLFRALELCKDRTVSYKDDILRAMLGARKRRWAASEPTSAAELSQTSGLVRRLLQGHYEHEAAQLRRGGDSDSRQAIELQADAEAVQRCFGEAMHALGEQRGAGPVPDFYCCKITMEVMLDPVTTPDGVSYERSALVEHLQKVGKFDPVTRRALEPSQLYPNLALKEAISTYLKEHPWAYESPL